MTINHFLETGDRPALTWYCQSFHVSIPK